MEKWTLGDISTAILFIVAFITGVGYLVSSLKKWITKLLEDQFKELGNRITELETKVDKIDIQTCKNFLVRFLADVEKGDHIYDPETQRFWEEYEHYTDAGGNSYVREWVDRLRKSGRL